MGIYNAYNDEELVKLLQNNNERAFELLFDRHWSHLYQSAFYLLRDSGASKDIVQEVFISLWSKENSSDIKNVKAYLRAAVRFKVANYIRAGNIRNSFFDQIENFPKNTGSPNGVELLEVMELQRVITDAIDQLPEKCREVYRLSKEEGLSNKEIAQRLGISVKTVENQMTIALKRIRGRIELHIILVLVLQYIIML